MANGTPEIPLAAVDPDRAAIVELLMATAQAIAAGAPVGAVILTFDHGPAGKANMRAFNIGDAFKCDGLLGHIGRMLISNQLKAEASQQSRIVVAHGGLPQ